MKQRRIITQRQASYFDALERRFGRSLALLKAEEKIFSLVENGATKKASKKIDLNDSIALEALEE